MSALDWLPHALDAEEVDVPPPFLRWLAGGTQEFGSWFLLDERGAAANKRNLQALYPARQVLPFARRADSDGVACLVLHDTAHPRGSVLVVHDGAMPGSEVEAVVPSLSQWFDQAQKDARHSVSQPDRPAAGVE